MHAEDHHRLDTPPPASQFRRPWSPDPYDPLTATRSLDDSNFAPRLHQYYRQRREPSDVSVEALDLADYAMTLRPHHAGYFAQEALHQEPIHQNTSTSSPQRSRPFSSQDSLRPPSLVSRGGTTSSQSHAHSSPLRRPFSLPPLVHYSANSRSHNPSITYPTTEPEVDISQFPAWSRNWYQSKAVNGYSLNTHTASHPDEAKCSPFDPDYNHSYPWDLPHSDPYVFPSVESSRDILPWTNDPPTYGPPIDADTKQERLRMLEREFGAQAKAKEGMFEGADGEPVIGSVDNHGRLVTQGPKKRIITRAVQILLALAAAIPSIYAALTIKSSLPPPPQSKPPAFTLYILSTLTFLALFYLFCIRPCCCGGKRTKPERPMVGGMMVLPVQGLPGGKDSKKGGKKGRKGGGGGQGDVQVNLIVDPGMFGGRGEDGESEGEDEDGYGGSIPGGFESRRRRRPRRSVFTGLAMEEQWRHARGWLKNILAFDVAGVVIWGAEFFWILIGKRCPSGQFDGWCDAYNVSSAAACLLCVSFGLSVFFDIKDLHTSKASPRTRP